MNSPGDLRQAINKLSTLPAIPAIAQKILSLKIATDEGERSLLALIEKDPPILARIVGLSNSPLFGAAKEIVTLHDAAALLGIKRIKMIALGFAMMSSMHRRHPGLLNVQNLWQHSMTVALAMDTLSRSLPDDKCPPDDQIYLAGLLHDIGFLVLDHIAPELSNQFHTRLAVEPGRPLEEVEAEMLEISHSELGAELGRHWDLPEAIIAVLRYHHHPYDERAVVGQPLVAMANLVERMMPTFGISESVRPDIKDEEWLALGIDPDRADHVMAAVQKHAAEVAAMFH